MITRLQTRGPYLNYKQCTNYTIPFTLYNPGRLAICMGRSKVGPDLPFMTLPFRLISHKNTRPSEGHLYFTYDGTTNKLIPSNRTLF